MQEDIDHRAVALVINTTKMTGRALKSAITKYLAHCRQKAKAPPTGRQTVRELVGQGQGVTNIEITDGNIAPLSGWRGSMAWTTRSKRTGRSRATWCSSRRKMRMR